MREKTKQTRRLEDCQPGASRKQVLGALSKVVKSHKSTGNGNGKASHAQREKSEKDKVNRAIDIVIERHLEVFKELERH